MAQAALALSDNERRYARQIKSAQASAVRQKAGKVLPFRRPSTASTAPPPKSPGEVIPFPGVNQSTVAETEAKKTQQLMQDQQQARMQQASQKIPEFIPSLQPAADRNLIDDTQLEEATNKAQALKQQLQTATTIAQVAGLSQQAKAMEKSFADLLLDDTIDNEINKIRENTWRKIRTELEAASVGTWGASLVAADILALYQFNQGIKYRGNNKEPQKLTTIFTPPPMRLTTPNEKAGDILAQVLYATDKIDFALKFLFTAGVVFILLLALLFTFIIIAILSDPIGAALDTNLRGFAEALGFTLIDAVTESIK